jgi:hypothetical protein
MICKKCGYEVENEEAKVCPVCGELLSESEAVEETAETAENNDVEAEETESGEEEFTPQPKKSNVGGKIVAGVIIIAALAGMGYMAYNNSDKTPRVDIESIEKIDVFENIPDDKAVEDKDSVVKAFTDALTALDNANSATIYTKNLNSTNDGSSQELAMLVKREADESGNQVADVEITQTYTYIDNNADTEEGTTGENVTADGESKTDTNTINYYYADGMLYCDTGDNKMQMEVSNDDILGQLNSYSMEIYAEYISKATCEQKGKNTKYTISMDPQAYQEFMLSNMSAQGAGLADDEEMELSYANIVFEVDENGALVNYAFVLDLTDTVGGVATEYKSGVTVAVTDFNKTKVTRLSDEELKAYAGEEETSDADTSVGSEGIEEETIGEGATEEETIGEETIGEENTAVEESTEVSTAQ